MEYLNALWFNRALKRFAPYHYGDLSQRQFTLYWSNVISLRTSPNGIFGYKAFIGDIGNITRKYPRIAEKFVPETIIYLTRDDLLGQAISYSRAIRSNSWFYSWGESRPPEYNFDHINGCIKSIFRQRNDWEALFKVMGIEPTRVKYEDVTSSCGKVLSLVAEGLGITLDSEKKIRIPMTPPQRDDLTETWRGRFLAECKGALPS